MNKNRGLTPLAVVLMLSGSLALTGCDDKQDQQGGADARSWSCHTKNGTTANHN